MTVFILASERICECQSSVSMGEVTHSSIANRQPTQTRAPVMKVGNAAEGSCVAPRGTRPLIKRSGLKVDASGPHVSSRRLSAAMGMNMFVPRATLTLRVSAPRPSPHNARLGSPDLAIHASVFTNDRFGQGYNGVFLRSSQHRRNRWM